MPPVKRKRAADFFSVGSDSEENGSEREEDREDESVANLKGGSDSEDEEMQDEEEGRTEMVKKAPVQKSDDKDEDDEDEDEEENKKEDKIVKPISKKELEKREKQIKKTGVVYISRIPPFMKPDKLKHILSRFGEVNRIFLVPEDPKVRARRVKYGGNKKKCFTEGWAEFKKKKHAKIAAETLNGNIIGGKKGNFFHDDILNVKYLHKFKWSNLTEQIAAENQARQEKMRAEIAQATRENRTFIDNVEKSKMIKGIKEKRAEKGKPTNEEDDFRRAFDQRKTTSRRADDNKKSNPPPASLSSVLSKVF
ncbi:hypothetical protein TRICI_004190 [Trichomonascus ciferrii]|uniref:Pre-rRNA-processing protein ESF2 n=1 Tax=Trichomonascus ciferrii TaxID=44093 RepID=A0A642V1U7_9ASCO|nr:hypothetical protein TRICI_004190 [Trichomonascus ciferrii]